ncbi:MAG: DoxX family protein [Pseudomonadota bacterium]
MNHSRAGAIKKAIFWLATLIVAGMLLFSAYGYLLDAKAIRAFAALGLPSYFRFELATLCAVGAVVMVAPRIPSPPREWAYAGAALFFLTGVTAHIANDDPMSYTVLGFLSLILLAISRFLLHHVR